MFAGELAGMNTSSTPNPSSAFLRFSMSRCSASWPRYVTGPAHARLSGAAIRPPRPTEYHS